jgi:hypothetical protein
LSYPCILFFLHETIQRETKPSGILQKDSDRHTTTRHIKGVDFSHYICRVNAFTRRKCKFEEMQRYDKFKPCRVSAWSHRFIAHFLIILFHCYIFSRSCEIDDASMLKYDSATMQKRRNATMRKDRNSKKAITWIIR